MAIRNFLVKISNLFNELKDTSSGYSGTSLDHNIIYVRHNGVGYKVTFEALDSINITDRIRNRHNNCDDETIESFEQIALIDREFKY